MPAIATIAARINLRKSGSSVAKRETPSAPDLEDVLSGKSTLSEQLERYPDLEEELDGLSDIVDLLRDAGERRRSRGEQILREEILGEEPASDERPDEGEPI